MDIFLMAVCKSPVPNIFPTMDVMVNMATPTYTNWDIVLAGVSKLLIGEYPVSRKNVSEKCFFEEKRGLGGEY